MSVLQPSQPCRFFVALLPPPTSSCRARYPSSNYPIGCPRVSSSASVLSTIAFRCRCIVSPSVAVVVVVSCTLSTLSVSPVPGAAFVFDPGRCVYARWLLSSHCVLSSSCNHDHCTAAAGVWLSCRARCPSSSHQQPFCTRRCHAVPCMSPNYCTWFRVCVCVMWCACRLSCFQPCRLPSPCNHAVPAVDVSCLVVRLVSSSNHVHLTPSVVVVSCAL